MSRLLILCALVTSGCGATHCATKAVRWSDLDPQTGAVVSVRTVPVTVCKPWFHRLPEPDGPSDDTAAVRFR